jgi:1,4-dihydroxy-2-naphthoate octaprenyltransferase
LSKLKVVLMVMRAPFLVLGPACMFLGLGLSIWEKGGVSIVLVVLSFLVGILAHISVNAFSEYIEFKNKMDHKASRIILNRGSGVLLKYPKLAWVALQVGIFSMILAVLIGIVLAIVGNPLVIPFGFIGILIVLTYFPFLVKKWFLALIAPGLGFGICAVLGIQAVLTHTLSWSGLLAALVLFFVVNNLSLLHEFPDAEVDRSVGRMHLVNRIGQHRAALIFTLFYVLMYVVILLGILYQFFPIAVLLGASTVILAVPTIILVLLYPDDRRKLIPAITMNLIITIATPVLMGVGFILS